jgi:hypothetical protein
MLEQFMNHYQVAHIWVKLFKTFPGNLSLFQKDLLNSNTQPWKHPKPEFLSNSSSPLSFHLQIPSSWRHTFESSICDIFRRTFDIQHFGCQI